MNDVVKSEKRANVAFELENKVKELKTKVGTSFLELGKTLKEIRDNQYYLDLGFESITQWLSSPDVSISPTWAWHFISVYEVLILERKLTTSSVLATDYNKLHQIVPVLRNNPSENAEEWLEKARSLRVVDLKREIQEFQGKDETSIADTSVAHIKVKLLLDWASMLKRAWLENNTDLYNTLLSEIEGEIKKATGLLDISKLKGDRE